MSSPNDENIQVPLASLTSLAAEYFRLLTWLGNQPPANAAPARHALRKIDDFLKLAGIEARSLTGLPFDAGLAARVVDAVEDPSLPLGQSIVQETVSPLVLRHGTVIRQAEIVTRTGTRKK